MVPTAALSLTLRQSTLTAQAQQVTYSAAGLTLALLTPIAAAAAAAACIDVLALHMKLA